MLLNQQQTMIVLRESLRSPLYGQYDEFTIAAAMVLESDTGYPHEIILSEGWFTDKLKKVGDFLKKSVAEPVKYGWAKYAPELYGQQTYKFWKRKELKAAAEKEFKAIVDQLGQDADEQFQTMYSAIKDQVAQLGSVPKGELGFPNMKSTDEFYTQLFGAESWEECEKIFSAIESGDASALESGDFTKGLFGKMALIKIMYQNSLDAAVGANPLDADSVEEIKKNANKNLKDLRDILQNYAQNTKEIYQTFENKSNYSHYANHILTEAEDADEGNLSEEELAQASSEMAAAMGISEDRLDKLKARMSPVRPLIAGVILGVVGAIGVKIGMDKLNDSINAYEKMLAAKDASLNDAIKELKNRVTDSWSGEIDVDNGYTQMVEKSSKMLSPLQDTSAGFTQNMGIGEFQEFAEAQGFGKEFWESVGANGGDSYDLLKKMIAENPNTKVVDFFKQSGELATKLSGKTLESPFGLKAGVGKLAIQGAKKALSAGTKKAISTGVGGYALAGLTVAGLPASLVAGIVAGGASAGLLTVAAIRKWKGNRLKLIMSCIDALSDLAGPRQSAVDTVRQEVEPTPVPPDVPPVGPPDETPGETGPGNPPEEPDPDEPAKEFEKSLELVYRALEKKGYDREQAKKIMDVLFDPKGEGEFKDAREKLTNDKTSQQMLVTHKVIHRNSLTSLLLTEEYAQELPYVDFENLMKKGAEKAGVEVPNEKQIDNAALGFNLAYGIGDVGELPERLQDAEVSQELQQFADKIASLEEKLENATEVKKKWMKKLVDEKRITEEQQAMIEKLAGENASLEDLVLSMKKVATEQGIKMKEVEAAKLALESEMAAQQEEWSKQEQELNDKITAMGSELEEAQAKGVELDDLKKLVGGIDPKEFGIEGIDMGMLLKNPTQFISSISDQISSKKQEELENKLVSRTTELSKKIAALESKGGKLDSLKNVYKFMKKLSELYKKAPGKGKDWKDLKNKDVDKFKDFAAGKVNKQLKKYTGVSSKLESSDKNGSLLNRWAKIAGLDD